jgi:hypothetical protein
VAGGEEKIEALEEIIRRLEEVKADQSWIGELDFEDARVDSYVAMALSAARSALTIAAKRDDPDATR